MLLNLFDGEIRKGRIFKDDGFYKRMPGDEQVIEWANHNIRSLKNKRCVSR